MAIVVLTAALEVGVALAGSSHGHRSVSPWGILILCLGAAVLMYRRPFPLWTLGATYVCSFLFQAIQSSTRGGGASWFPVIVAFATAIYQRRRYGALVYLVVGYVLYLWGPLIVGHSGPSAIFALSLGGGLLALVGISEWFRLRHERSVAQARSRQEELRRVMAEQRLTMARDLHDVVAHNISAINVQASTALHLLDRQPERARDALETINDVSKQALVELRSILGVLRRVDEDAPRSPTPSLGRLDEVLSTARAAGLAVHLEQIGQPQPLPADVDLAACRIIQESLTNTVRHSGASSAHVCLRYEEGALVVEVNDSGSANHPEAPCGTGSGITGMGERARALGGTLRATPLPEGGFSVRARLPVGNTR